MRAGSVAAITCALWATSAGAAFAGGGGGGGGGGMAPATGDDDPSGDPTGTSEPVPGPTAPAAGTTAPVRVGHHHQFGLAAQIITGGRVIKTWDNTTFCGDRGDSSGTGNAAICFSRVPTTLDLAVSYGLTSHIEGLFEMRLGLERDFGATATSGDGPRLRHYAPGVRFYFNPDERMKFFSTAQLSIDATGYKDASGGGLGADVLLRNANGLMFDFHEAYGAYAFFGEELGFRRWLDVDLEVGLGIQGRYP